MESEVLMRDLVQARVLGAIFARSVRDEVVLKGGMALRALFGSQRYTKDIDLAQDRSHSLGSLQRLMRAAIADATKGMLHNLVVTEPKQTDTVARWKVHGNTAAGTHIGLTIEVSRRGYPREHVLAKSFQAPGKPAVTIDVYDAEALAASKVFALASDNRVAARDLLDLDLLIKMDVHPSPALFASITDRPAFIKQIWDKIELMTWHQFQNDVLPYMDVSARSRYTEDSFAEMQILVGTEVERWLSDEVRAPKPSVGDAPDVGEDEDTEAETDDRPSPAP
jgi:predicted nucleotidyltransferase component of viral defense system